MQSISHLILIGVKSCKSPLLSSKLTFECTYLGFMFYIYVLHFAIYLQKLYIFPMSLLICCNKIKIGLSNVSVFGDQVTSVHFTVSWMCPIHTHHAQFVIAGLYLGAGLEQLNPLGVNASAPFDPQMQVQRSQF